MNQHPVLVKERGYNYNEDVLNTPIKISFFLNNLFSMNNLAEEYLYLISFNVKMKVLGVFEVFHGSVSQCLINPREIFIRLLLTGAVNFVLCHNHPSGDATPSKEDILMTNKLLDCSRLMEIIFTDHIIIGDNEFCSFKEKKLM